MNQTYVISSDQVPRKEYAVRAKTFCYLLMGAILVFPNVFAFAEDESWYVVKDKDNICKIISSKAKTDNSVAGPFALKEQAAEALEKSCPKSTVEKLKDKAAEGLEKAKAEAEKLKAEVEKLKEKAAPGIEAAKDAADKLKGKAEEGIDKAREMIKQHLPEKNQ